MAKRKTITDTARALVKGSSAAAAELGRKGGSATGESKRRPHLAGTIRGTRWATLTNEKHGTRVRLRVRATGVLTAAQAIKAQETLCPYACCPGWLSTVGPQAVGIDKLAGSYIITWPEE